MRIDCIHRQLIRCGMIGLTVLVTLLSNSNSLFAATITSTIGSDVSRDYSTMTAWEAALGGAAGGAGNDAVGEVYNDSAFDEQVLIDEGTSDSILLTVPSTERHNGTAGNGSRIVRTSSGYLMESQSASSTTVEWLELDQNGEHNISSGIFVHDVNASGYIYRYLILHDANTGNGNLGYHQNSNGGREIFHNSFVYDIASNNTGAEVHGVSTNSTRDIEIYNVTVFNVKQNTGAAPGRIGVGIHAGDRAGVTVQNCIVVDVDANQAGSMDYDDNIQNPTNATVSHNLSEDATSTGTGAVTGAVTANQFISTVDGSENLHLKAGSDALLVGTNLGTTPSGVNIDIDGFDRTTTVLNWDMGAHQFSQDNTNPSVNTLSPTDGSTSVGLTDNLIITFTEAVDVETGNINLYKASDDSVVETIDVTSANVTGTGTTTITINPTGDLEDATDYYVQIDATAFDDTAGNSYAGINDTTTWNFSTTLTVDEEVFSIALTINGGGLAKRGDILKGTLSLTNTKGTIITNTDVRLKLPQGINYIADTATSSDNITLSRIIKENHDTLFRIASFPRNAEGAIDFKLIVGSNVQDGETLTMTIHTENT